MISFETVVNRSCSSNDSDFFKPAKAATSRATPSGIYTPEQVHFYTAGRRSTLESLKLMVTLTVEGIYNVYYQIENTPVM